MSGEKAMAKNQEDVCILFSYICDFNDILKTENKKIVKILDNLFREFDSLCEQIGVQKIETVGYTYLASTGIEECEKNFTDKQQ